MIYTSYWGNMRKLKEAGIEPVQISRMKPKFCEFNGRSIMSLAPTWEMLRMDGDMYDAEYAEILKRNNADDVVRFLGEGDVALMCFEKDPEQCHRSKVMRWLNANGYECEEFRKPEKPKRATPSCHQMSLF